MLIKKEILFTMIDDIKSCSIVGVPTKEVQNTYFNFNGNNILDLFDKHKINYKIDKFENTDVSIYFPNFLETTLNEICMITIYNPTLEQLANIEKLFVDVRAYYQVAIPPAILNKIVGIHPEPLTFSTMLMLIPEKSQAKIAEKVGKSRQAIGDIKSGKNKLTLEVLSRLVNLYPLLPWEEFIEQYGK